MQGVFGGSSRAVILSPRGQRRHRAEAARRASAYVDQVGPRQDRSVLSEIHVTSIRRIRLFSAVEAVGEAAAPEFVRCAQETIAAPGLFPLKCCFVPVAEDGRVEGGSGLGKG
jgi:hypothetical protein